MPSLPSIPHLSREMLVAIGVVVALLVLWIWMLYDRRRYVVIKKSDAVEDITYQLGRIANALDSLVALSTPRDFQATTEEKPQQRQWLSLFGR